MNTNVLFFVVLVFTISGIIASGIILIIKACTQDKETFSQIHTEHTAHMSKYNTLSELNDHLKLKFWDEDKIHAIIKPVRYRNSRGIIMTHNNLNVVLFPVNPAIQIITTHSEHGMHLFYGNFKNKHDRAKLHQTHLMMESTNENKYNLYMQTKDIRTGEPLPRKWKGVIEIYYKLHNVTINNKFDVNKHYIIIETDTGIFEKYRFDKYDNYHHAYITSPKYLKFYIGTATGKFIGIIGNLKILQVKLELNRILDDFSVIEPQFEIFKFSPVKSTEKYALWENKDKDIFVTVESNTLEGPKFKNNNGQVRMNPTWFNTSKSDILSLYYKVKTRKPYKNTIVDIWTLFLSDPSINLDIKQCKSTKIKNLHTKNLEISGYTEHIKNYKNNKLIYETSSKYDLINVNNLLLSNTAKATNIGTKGQLKSLSDKIIIDASVLNKCKDFLIIDNITLPNLISVKIEN